jgi:hypothetical protein
MRFFSIILALSIIVFPLYLFPSGQPQAFDFLMAFLLLAWVAIAGFRIKVIRMPVEAGLLIVFAVYTAAINLLNAMWFSEIEILKPVPFYLYNVAVYLMCVSLASVRGGSFLNLISFAFLAACFIQLVYVILLAEPSVNTSRSMGTFNNPNQLGYFSLLGACSFFYIYEKLDVHWWAGRYSGIVLVFGASSFLLAALMSSSKAAIVSLIVLYIMIFIRKPLYVVIFLPCIFLLLTSKYFGRYLDTIVIRFTNIGVDPDDSMSGRGYDRIMNHLEYTFFGAGEGAIHRFETTLSGELHSSIGTLIFSYGIVGCAIFLLAILCFARSDKAAIKYLLVIALYGLTHQGLRNTMLWVFFGILSAISFYRESASANQEKIILKADKSLRSRNLS